MKTLDKRASEILRALLALQTSKIDNTDEAYMPVYIEIIDRSESYNHISLAHYGEQNGDMMRDPETTDLTQHYTSPQVLCILLYNQKNHNIHQYYCPQHY